MDMYVFEYKDDGRNKGLKWS